jgi:eukaryotic-like serine/threonine-protein kinase
MNVTASMGRVLSSRYEVGELLGSGGMASVWRGHDLRLDRAVAIKELTGPWVGDQGALQRFDREARMAARLTHPNIVAVYDVDIHDRTPYLVMELVEGATVAQLLSDGPLPIAAAVSITAQACDGLATAHAAGIIHRDVKPANLMITADAVVKICDFGIARALSSTVDPTVSGPMYAMGTSKYMAPEQAWGERVDARADLYGLGCTMYAMLAGTPPFHGNPAEVLQQHLTRAPALLRDYRTDIPAPLEALVMQLLAKNPDDRPTDAEVRARLVDLMGGSTPAGIPVGASTFAMRAVPAAVRPRKLAAPVDQPGPARRRAGVFRHWPIAVAALVTTLGLAAAGWRLVVGEPVGPTARPAPSTTASVMMTASLPPTRAAAPPKVPTASQTPPPSSPAARPSSQPPPPEPIAVLRVAIQQQVNTGNLNPDKASDLYKAVDAIAHSAYVGNTSDESKNIKALQDRLTALRTGGQLSASGYDILNKDLDAVAATIT